MKQTYRLGSTIAPAVISLFSVAAFLLVVFFAIQTNVKNKPNVNTKTESAVCTREAKLCPDGSYVDREGPNCEFAACPEVNSNSSETTNINSSTVTNENINSNAGASILPNNIGPNKQRYCPTPYRLAGEC